MYILEYTLGESAHLGGPANAPLHPADGRSGQCLARPKESAGERKVATGKRAKPRQILATAGKFVDLFETLDPRAWEGPVVSWCTNGVAVGTGGEMVEPTGLNGTGRP